MYRKYRKRKMNKNIPKASTVNDEQTETSNVNNMENDNVSPESATTVDTVMNNGAGAGDDSAVTDSTKESNSEPSATTDPSVSMVIDLDRYAAEKRGIKKLRDPNNPCINFNCSSGVNIHDAPMFCLTYYCVKMKPNKKQMVCEECFETAFSYFETQVTALTEGQFLADLERPVREECVEIIDSDEEEEEDTDGAAGTEKAEEEDEISEEAAGFILDNLPDIIVEMAEKYDLDGQVDYACDVVEQRVKKVGETLDELNDIHKTLQDKVDKLRKELYSNFQTEIQSIPPIEIIDVFSPIPTPGRPPVAPGTKRTPPAARGQSTIALSPTTTLAPSSTLSVLYPRPVREAERRSHRNISKPASYCEPSDDVELPVAVPVVETDIQVVSVPGDVGLQADSRLDLPPRGPLERPRPLIGETYYAMRHSVFNAWGRVRLLEILSAGDAGGNASAVYKVRFDGKAKGQSLIKIVNGKQLAYAQPCPVRLDVGTRVIAVFKDETSVKRDSFFTGVVAEPLCQANSYRYLVFFDDGYAQYVRHEKVMLVVECSRHVWDDIHPDSRLFIRKYLEKYPERPMVKLQAGQVVKTEWNGKWWIARVVRVEGSLVQMYFDADARSEWIYRGSARLSPLFLEMQAATNRQEKGPHIPKIQNARKNLPYVEYTRNDGHRNSNAAGTNGPDSAAAAVAAAATTSITPTSSVTIISEPPGPPVPVQPRAVARKSTNRPANTLPTPSYGPVPYINSNMVPFLPTPHVQQPQSKVVYYTPKTIIAPKPYVPHVCSLDCSKYVTLSLSQLKGYNPLSKPLLCGWYRQLCKYKGKKVVRYRAPCARMLRNMTELHQYLRTTGSQMSVDMFDFDFWVHCLAEFVLDKTYRHKRDISNGVEHVPIPCVNYVDNTMPDFTSYSTKREPMEGVNLNLDEQFLCGCDCQDDCADKSKCACWQLTIREARTLNKRVPDDLIGYTYKRLPEFVTTGIYECNARCKCAATCLNRVVQHPLQLKLQLFKTANRGWGIRCLNDIPQGAFICIYAGSLLTDKMANEGGVNYGDEYLAELDYIEVVERQKEGYESDVTDMEDDGEKDDDRDDDEAEDETYVYEDTGTGEKDEDGEYVCPVTDGITESTIRTRSRKRTAEVHKQESTTTSTSSSITGGDDSNSNGATATSGKIPRTEPQQQLQTQEPTKPTDDDTVTISDDDDNVREPSRFDPSSETHMDDSFVPKFKSVRKMFGEDEVCYIMDAKNTGNIGRFLNHSCSPNVFVQNVFVDTHDLRFPWVAFFAMNYIRAGTELTWNYNYDVGSVPNKVIFCHCGSPECRGRLL